MRKSLAAIASLVLLLSACTTAGSSDTTAPASAPIESATVAAPETAAPPTTVAPAGTAPPTTTESPTTTGAPRAPAPTTAVEADPAPVLARPAALQSVVLTMTSPQSGEGPIAIWVEDPTDLPITVTLSALATPEPRGDSFFWEALGTSFFDVTGNPNVQSFDLTIPAGQDSQTYTISVTSSGPPDPQLLEDSIDILLTYNSDLTQ